MKYAIYDKAADGYLTKMELEVGYSEHTQFECGYNEYITEAQLLDTPKEAADAIVRIESFKFMEKGRFVVHSFDDALNDQYIISEAGNPTKVVDNITVNIDGTIDVKYGTMVSHWSALSLNYAVNRLNRLQDASAPTRYCSWNDTFDIYKVINVIDEKSCTHYQFINVTAEGLEKYSKDEKESTLNKCIEELEKANYELGQQSFARGLQANRLKEENDNLKEENDDLKTKVESIKKEARDWKQLYENANRDREVEDFVDELYEWKSKAQKAEKTLDDQKKLNDANKATIARMVAEKIATNRELLDWKLRAKEAISDYIRCNRVLGEWKRKCKAKDTDYEMLKNKLQECEVTLDSTHELLTKTIEERDKALERAEKFKGIANSVYGITVPGRCCGKQLMADILSGKKIPISKKKYDDLVEYVNNINLTYDNMFCMMDKPVYLSTITESLNDLTK